ncbi:S1C family serine protease [Cellulosilyticum ruminicola]|uniref:S1C family serine protease n=1 Tax=Cellulosilyticum ruminicola TaxID=425254 RepID=UPI0006D11749|nr:trypsin-like peptidase domain-containing protein [Cellulosilyticum ruminicola]
MYYEDDEAMKALMENRMKAEQEELRKQEETRKQEAAAQALLKSEKARATRKKIASIIGVCTLTVGSFGLGGYVFNQYPNKEAAVVSETTASKQTNLVQTATNSRTGSSLSVVEVASIAADSVVEITTEIATNGRHMQQFIAEGAGSGVVVSKEGYIVTNNHVINGASKITVRLRNGETYEATLVGTDSKTDVALLKIQGATLTPASLGDSDQLQVGELAVAIGNPLGQLGGTVTNGIISALDREITLDGQTMNLLQTNAAINPGNSGGGLFNDQGQLVGLVVAKSAGSDVEGLGFAIPVNEVKNIVNELMNNGYVTGRPVLGVSVLQVDSLQTAMQYRLNRMGVYIQGLTPGTNSEKSGLAVGDCILAIDNQEVTDTADISKILQDKKVGDTVKMTISRDGQMLTKNLVLSENKPQSN